MHDGEGANETVIHLYKYIPAHLLRGQQIPAHGARSTDRVRRMRRLARIGMSRSSSDPDDEDSTRYDGSLPLVLRTCLD